MRHQHHYLGCPLGVRLARRDLHEAERLRQQPTMVRRAQPAEHHIPLDPGSPRRCRDGVLLLDFIGHLGLNTAQEAAWQVMQLLQHVIIDRAPIKDVEPTRRHQPPSLGTLRGVARCDRHVDQPMAQDRKGDVHCCRPMLVVVPRAVRTACNNAASNTEAAALSAPSEVRRMPTWACTCAKVVSCCRPRKLVTVGVKKDNSSKVAYGS